MDLLAWPAHAWRVACSVALRPRKLCARAASRASEFAPSGAVSLRGDRDRCSSSRFLRGFGPAARHGATARPAGWAHVPTDPRGRSRRARRRPGWIRGIEDRHAEVRERLHHRRVDRLGVDRLRGARAHRFSDGTCTTSCFYALAPVPGACGRADRRAAVRRGTPSPAPDGRDPISLRAVISPRPVTAVRCYP